MARLPTGTVTFLFTDVESSTRLLQELGKKYADVLADQRSLLRFTFQAHGGEEVDTQGDACFYAFSRARDALEAAIAVQHTMTTHPWPDGIAVRVRVGMHTGEPISADGGYVGMAVHRAARICAAAHGGQILISQATRELVEEELPAGVILRDLGAYRLKDLSRAQRLFQVVVAGLPSEFPPPKTPDSLPNNLPRQLTSFIGREREIVEINDLVAGFVLVTLIGAGGSGKTRLGLQVAAQVLDRIRDGVWWVELAALSEPTLVPQAVASALGVREQPGRALLDTLLDYLNPKTLLLIIDNAEHLLSACAQLTDTLLRRCPHLRILVTSREALRIEGERVYPVSPLPVPSPNVTAAMSSLVRNEAVQLFLDRATAARPSFTLNDRNAAFIADICRRVDGIPLALELAAARVKVLSVEQIFSRLDDQFRLLTNGSRTALPRQQTLRATLDWSFDLLARKERDLFQRLAIFAGGFTLEAAEAVCTDSGVNQAEVLALLTRLVEKSLLIVEEPPGEMRFRLLEPVRQYAMDKLEEAGALLRIRARHRDFFLTFAGQGHVALIGPDALQWLRRIESEHDNIRTGLRWSMENGDKEAAALLATAMARFWARRGFLQEGQAWLQEVRAHGEQISTAARAGALSGAGLLAFEIGDHRECVHLIEQALMHFQQIDARDGIERCTRLLGMVELERGNYQRGNDLLEKAAALARERGDEVEAAEALRQRGYAAAKQGDYTLATQLLESSLALHRQHGAKRSAGFALGHLAQVYHYQGHSQRSVAMFEEALSILQAVEHKTGIAYFLNLLALAKLAVGDGEGAAATYRRSLSFSKGVGYKWAIAQGLIGFGALNMARGDREGAVRLLAAADALLKVIEYELPAAEQAQFQQHIETLRRSVDTRDFERIWAAGQAMTPEQAVELALQDQVTRR